MKRDDNNPRSDDSLDQAIRDSLQIDSDQERLARLERYWITQSQKQLWRRRTLLGIPLAAAALAAVAALIVVRYGREGTQTAQAIRESTPLRGDSVSVEPLLADSAQVATPSRSAGRPSTAYERLVFAARTRLHVPTTSLTAGIDHAIDRLTISPDSDAKQVLDSSGLRRFDAETVLLQRLSQAADAQQAVILRLLAVCGTRRSVPTLLRLGRHDATRNDALAVIQQIVGIEDLARVVGSTTDRKFRAAIMLRLLTADSEAALLGYLSLVHNGAARREALAVAEVAPQLPVGALLTLLDHEEKGVRFSAAIVLGHTNGPDVTKLLIARVIDKPSGSTEAWLALLACRGELAEEFLAYATHRPQLLGYFNSARVRWAQMVPVFQ